MQYTSSRKIFHKAIPFFPFLFLLLLWLAAILIVNPAGVEMSKP